MQAPSSCRIRRWRSIRSGGGQEREIQRTIDSFREIARRIADQKPDTIVLTSPHAVLYSDYFHISPGTIAKGDLRAFAAADAKLAIDYDEAFARSIAALAAERQIPAGMLGERERALDHGTLVPLLFVQQSYSSYKLVRIGLSGLPLIAHYEFGKCIQQAAQQTDKRVVLIASGDLSHKLTKDGPYGFAPEGPEFDKSVTDAMASGDFLQFLRFDEDFLEAAAECGLRSFVIMAGALDGLGVKPELLSYEGPFGVGYAVASFAIGDADESRRFGDVYEQEEQQKLQKSKEGEDEYVRLARQSLEYYIRTHTRLKRPEGLLESMVKNRAGVFVSLKKDGNLRGCIGTITPTTECIADEIIRMAVSASTEDPRFSPVREEELPKLVYSVDVLMMPEPIKSIEDLDVKKYGVIVRSRGKLGLLLPNLEGVDTPQEQVEIAMQKGNISPSESYSLERFEVVRHK